MRAIIHCYAYDVKIDLTKVEFEFDEFHVSLENFKHEEKEGVMLEISCKVESKSFLIPEEERDPLGNFIRVRLQPFKSKLNHSAAIVEGLFAIKYNSKPPKFITNKALVNFEPETPEDEELIKVNGGAGFGDIMSPLLRPIYSLPDNFFSNINKISPHAPSFSFLSQAIHSQENDEEEVAFTLYFRILEGYLSDGSTKIEKALQKNKVEMEKYFPYFKEIDEDICSVLTLLNLFSRQNHTYSDFIFNLVLLRHKIVHFSAKNAETHYSPTTKFKLEIINRYLRLNCIRLLNDKIK